MKYIYGATDLIGGIEGSLDSIDGASLTTDDSAIVTTPELTYFYTLVDSSGVTESSPDVILPDNNGDDKHWVLTGTSHRIEVINDLGVLDGTSIIDINLNEGTIVTATVSTATQTFTFSNPPSVGNGSFSLFLTNGGSQTVNFPISVNWVNETEPILTASGIDVLVFTTNDAGTSWFGFVSGLDMK